MRSAIALLVIVTSVTSCGSPASTATTEMPLPPGTEAQADAACENLRRIGCPEGFGTVGGTSCLGVVINAYKLQPLPLACWAKAIDSASAKGCGSLRCVR